LTCGKNSAGGSVVSNTTVSYHVGKLLAAQVVLDLRGGQPLKDTSKNGSSGTLGTVEGRFAPE
jgi:hypothetical protein